MTDQPQGNLLCYGDSLTFLADRTFLPDSCMDLIYLDPPFNSRQNCNVLFKEAPGSTKLAKIGTPSHHQNLCFPAN